MTAKDYKLLAQFLGQSLARAHALGGEEARTLLYDAAYTGAVEMLAADNPRFDQTRFSYAVAQAEHAAYVA